MNVVDSCFVEDRGAYYVGDLSRTVNRRGDAIHALMGKQGWVQVSDLYVNRASALDVMRLVPPCGYELSVLEVLS